MINSIESSIIAYFDNRLSDAELAALMRDFPGDSRINLILRMSDCEKQLVLGPQYKVRPVPDFFAEAKALLGEAAVP